MNIWISSNIKSKNHFAVHAAAGLLGIVFTAVILIAFGSIVTIHCSESKETILLLLCLTVTALVIFLGLRLGWHLQCYAVVFFKNNDGQLFVTDVRQSVHYGRGLTGYIAASEAVQRKLDMLLQYVKTSSQPPHTAFEIISVKKLTEHSRHYTLVCRIRRGNTEKRETYRFDKHTENAQSLIYLLESKTQSCIP